MPEVGGAVDDAASPTLAMLAAAAKEHGVFLVGGECLGLDSKGGSRMVGCGGCAYRRDGMDDSLLPQGLLRS